MSSVTKVTNNSNKHLVVRSLKVLEGIEGSGLQEIKSTVNALANAQTSLASKTQDYWSVIASDSNITPEEKKTLYKEWKTIQSEYTALINQAAEEGIGEKTTALVAYKAAYQNLYNELVTNLKLFDSMSTTTVISDRDDFIAFYDNYYSTKETLRSLIYQTQGATTYILEIAPDFQTVAVDGNGDYINPEGVITLEVNLLSGTDGIDYAVTRYASIDGETVGVWSGNLLTVPVTEFTENSNYLTITVSDKDGYIFSTSACISKLYAGNSIEQVVTWFLVSDKKEGVTKDESGWSTTPPTMTSDKPYLWTYQEMWFIDGSTKETEASLTGATGEDGNGIKKITAYYLASGFDSGITVETSGWTEDIQTISPEEPYLWSYNKITYTDDKEIESAPIIIGTYSDSLTVYDMHLDKTSIKEGNNGKTVEEEITAEKWEITAEYTRRTQTGHIYADSYKDDVQQARTEIDCYSKASIIPDFYLTYYKKMEPVMIKVDDETVLCNDEDTAAIIYIRS